MIVQANSEMIHSKVQEDVWIHSTCEMCYGYCGILVHRVDGTVVKIEGDPEHPNSNGKLCAKGLAALMSLYDPNRVKTPLRRTNPKKGIGENPKWEKISWEEALGIIVEKLKKIRKEEPRKFIMSDWDIPMRRIFLREYLTAFGTTNPVMLAAYRCGSALHSVTYETNATFHTEIDFDYCNYSILFGNQMGFMVGRSPNILAQKMAEARKRGMKLVVIDPLCTNAAAKADEWVPIRPGTDGALALSMLHVLLNEAGIYDAEFLKKHTNAPYLIGDDGHYLRDKETQKPLVWDKVDGKAKPFDDKIKDYALEGSYTIVELKGRPAFDYLKENIKKYTPEEVSTITTVPAETIRRIALEYGEAAKIGSKIVIEGKEIPYRPAATNFYRGVTARKHGSTASLAVQLLNLVVGAFYTVGGHRGTNAVGPGSTWTIGKNEDGLPLVPAAVGLGVNPFDFHIRRPTTVGFHSWLPFDPGPGAGLSLSLLDPEKYKSPVTPEVMLHCRTNVMLSRENLDNAAATLKKIPFIVTFATHIDETAEFADIVLPDTHSLERLVLAPNQPHLNLDPSTGYWYWGIIQPVVEPAGEARNWIEVLFEIAYRVGFLKEYHELLNIYWNLKGPYKLEPDKKYSLEELFDRKAKSDFGAGHDLAWFKEHSCLVKVRTVEEKYPLSIIEARFPIYFENYLRVGEEIKEFTPSELGFSWDTSDFLPVPDWKVSPAYKRKSAEHDLVCINYKIPVSAHTITAENPWLNEICEHHPYYYKILLNAGTASKKNIKDGDDIWVESIAGKIKGRVKLTECIHPEVVGIAGTFGAWAKGKPIARGKGINHNTLLPMDLDRIDGVSLAVDDCVEVKVYKARK